MNNFVVDFTDADDVIGIDFEEALRLARADFNTVDYVWLYNAENNRLYELLNPDNDYREDTAYNYYYITHIYENNQLTFRPDEPLLETLDVYRQHNNY